jgi:hypothetical protein
MKRLKDESDLVAPHLRQRGLVEPADLPPIEPVGTGGRSIEAAQQVEQRRLARARRAHDRDVISLGHRQIEVA